MSNSAETGHAELQAFLYEHYEHHVALVVGGVVLEGTLARPETPREGGQALPGDEGREREVPRHRGDLVHLTDGWEETGWTIRVDRIDAWGGWGPGHTEPALVVHRRPGEDLVTPEGLLVQSLASSTEGRAWHRPASRRTVERLPARYADRGAIREGITRIELRLRHPETQARADSLIIDGVEYEIVDLRADAPSLGWRSFVMAAVEGR